MPHNKVKNPEQMTHKKFVPGANPLVQIPRGWAAGTAGLPGDIEGLARLFAKYAGAPGSIAEKWGQQETPALPTSEFYKEWLPLKDERLGAAELNTLGSLAGGAGSTTLAGLGVKYGTKAAMQAGKAGERLAERSIPKIMERGGLPAEMLQAMASGSQSNVIKKPGGNWLAGQPGDSLGGLKRTDQQAAYRNMSERMGAPDPVPPQVTSEQSINDWVDKKLAKYVEKQMASSEDPVRLMADAWPEKKAKLLDLAQAKIDMYAQKIVNTARERGQPEHTLTEMRQEMIKLEKEKALIEARGGLHVAPEGLNFRPEMHGKYLSPGQTAVAVSPDARVWEGASDLKVATDSAENWINTSPSPTADNPWLLKVPPETEVHGISEAHLAPDLGFDHLIDELRNATNAESGLPAELLWDAKDLAKKTVPDAVEHVSKINAWRAAQNAEADAMRANNAATHVFKEYAENNPEGFKWVELKTGKELPTGYNIENLNNVPTLYGPEGKSLAQNWDYDTLVAQANRPSLEDALKYEGDTMAHCVGGYCDKVADGSTRIFSLRDAKGKPYVTIETRRGDGWDRAYNDNVFNDEFYKYLESKGMADDYANGMFDDATVDRLAMEFTKNNTVDSIKQIKGFSNRKPDDEYLPYVQDFVKSGKWSDVGDLQNTGLVRKSALGPEAASHPSDYLTMEEIQELRKGKVWQPIDDSPELDLPDDLLPRREGFAAGGSVYSPARVDEIISQHRNSEYDPARVDALVAQLKEEIYG